MTGMESQTTQGKVAPSSITLPDDSGVLSKIDYLPDSWKVLLGVEEDVIALESAQKLTLSQLKQEIAQQKGYLTQLETAVSLGQYKTDQVVEAEEYLEKLKVKCEVQSYNLNQQLADTKGETDKLQKDVEARKGDLQARLEEFTGLNKNRENANKKYQELLQKYNQAGSNLRDTLKAELDRAENSLNKLNEPSYESNIRTAAENCYAEWWKAQKAVHETVVKQDNLVRLIQKCEKRLAYLKERRNTLIEACIKEQLKGSKKA